MRTIYFLEWASSTFSTNSSRSRSSLAAISPCLATKVPVRWGQWRQECKICDPGWRQPLISCRSMAYFALYIRLRLETHEPLPLTSTWRTSRTTFLKNECLSWIFILLEWVLVQLRHHSQNIITTKTPLPEAILPVDYTWLIPLILITINSSSEKTIRSSPNLNPKTAPTSLLISFSNVYNIKIPFSPTPKTIPFATIYQSRDKSPPFSQEWLQSTPIKQIFKSKEDYCNPQMDGGENWKTIREKSLPSMGHKDFDTMPFPRGRLREGKIVSITKP